MYKQIKKTAWDSSAATVCDVLYKFDYSTYTRILAG